MINNYLSTTCKKNLAIEENKTTYLMAENDVLFRENEELVEERLRFSKQKTSFSCEETPTFWRKSDF